jgi:hypothetical protein
VMGSLGTICWAFVGPILADGLASPDAGPTYLLAAACTGFLGALAWAVRAIVVWGRDGITVFYGEIVIPMKTGHLELLQTLKETREKDSVSLATLAADVHALRSDIKCRHDA